MNFSENLAQLDDILKQLEDGSLPLDEAMKVFERGVALVRENRNFLAKAEQKVTMLTRSGEEVPFVRDEAE